MSVYSSPLQIPMLELEDGEGMGIVSASSLCVPPSHHHLVVLPPAHLMQAHPDVYSCVVKKCPLEMKERLSTMTSPVHVDNVTQWLQTTRVLSYS